MFLWVHFCLGIDFSLIVALMQEISGAKIKTFSMGFNDRQYDEAPFAKAVATHLGTDHSEHYVTAGEALDVIPKLQFCLMSLLQTHPKSQPTLSLK